MVDFVGVGEASSGGQHGGGGPTSPAQGAAGASASCGSASATASGTAQRGWRVGGAVRVRGLTKATQHNGKLGRLCSVPADASARVGVALDDAGGGPPLSVRRENVELLEERAPQQQPTDILDVD